MKMAEGGADYDALMKKMDKLQTAIDAIEGWELDRQLERAMQALRCPPGTLCRKKTRNCAAHNPGLSSICWHSKHAMDPTSRLCLCYTPLLSCCHGLCVD